MEDEYPCPEWYFCFVVAEQCNCKPWEVPDIPLFWTQKALIKRTAEAEAQESIDNFRGH